jgi:hypothetical protein
MIIIILAFLITDLSQAQNYTNKMVFAHYLE